MKVSELREMNVDDVKNKLEEFHEESFNLRFQQATGAMESTARMRGVKRDVARVNTILNEKAAAAAAE